MDYSAVANIWMHGWVVVHTKHKVIHLFENSVIRKIGFPITSIQVRLHCI